MKWEAPEGVVEVFRRAEKEPLLSDCLREPGPTVLDRKGVQAVLPFRDPYLFVDEVRWLDLDRSLIAARYDLSRSAAIFAGHTPKTPLFPGAMQLEAMGQAGCLLYLKQVGVSGDAHITITHLIRARFIRAIGPGGDLDVLAHVQEDGLFFLIVGQCLRRGKVCSLMLAKAIYHEGGTSQ